MIKIERILLLGSLLVTAAATTGCGASQAAVSHTARAATPITAAAPTTSSNAATTPGSAPSTSTTTASTPPAASTQTAVSTEAARKTAPDCSVKQLRIEVWNLAGATGTEHAYLRFTNTGNPCVLAGYPGLQPIATDGREVRTKLIRGPLSSASVQRHFGRITLARGRSAWTDVYWKDQCNNYLEPRALLVTPPNSYTSATVSVKPHLGSGNVAICGSDLYISPVFPQLANPNSL